MPDVARLACKNIVTGYILNILIFGNFGVISYMFGFCKLPTDYCPPSEIRVYHVSAPQDRTARKKIVNYFHNRCTIPAPVPFGRPGLNYFQNIFCSLGYKLLYFSAHGVKPCVSDLREAGMGGVGVFDGR